MQKPSAGAVIRFGVLALVVGAIISGFPARLFHRETPLRPPGERPPMPDFTLRQLGGDSWGLKEHAGSVILLNFWATWCAPCRQETPALVRLYHRYRDSGFTIAGITVDEDPKRVVPEFVGKYGIDYPVLVPGPHFGPAEQIEALPTSLLVDRNGRLAWSHVGAVDEDDLAAKIERLLAEKGT